MSPHHDQAPVIILIDDTISSASIVEHIDHFEELGGKVVVVTDTNNIIIRNARISNSIQPKIEFTDYYWAEYYEHLDYLDEFRQFCLVTSMLLALQKQRSAYLALNFKRKTIPKSRRNLVGLFNTMKLS